MRHDELMKILRIIEQFMSAANAHNDRQDAKIKELQEGLKDLNSQLAEEKRYQALGAATAS